MKTEDQKKRSKALRMVKQVSRRDFLILSGLGLLGVAFRRVFSTDLVNGQTVDPDTLFGRVTHNNVRMFSEPDSESELVQTLSKDSVLQITEVTVDANPSARNRVWYALDDLGFVHSGRTQPVYWVKNPVTAVVPEKGCLGEVTVPYVDAVGTVDDKQSVQQRCYYASTFWVTAREQGSAGRVWYQLWDDRYYYRYFYVPADTIRLIPDAEFSPISSHVNPADKKILVDLGSQILTAYENEKIVFMSRISGGLRDKEGELTTPLGFHRITVKRPCRFMFMAPSEAGPGYSLPGVPWVSYFDKDGMAFHGTYWHNNFGLPQSAGCINLPPKAAKWVYRWTDPAAPPDAYRYGESSGTLVHIR